MAQKYLEVVATFVSSERLFSYAVNVLTPEKSTLESENVEKLIISTSHLLRVIFQLNNIATQSYAKL